MAGAADLAANFSLLIANQTSAEILNIELKTSNSQIAASN